MAWGPLSSSHIATLLQVARFQPARLAARPLNPTLPAPLLRSRDTDKQLAWGSSDSCRAAGLLLDGRWDCTSFTGSALSRLNRPSANVEKWGWEAAVAAELCSGCAKKPARLESSQSREGRGSGSPAPVTALCWPVIPRVFQADF